MGKCFKCNLLQVSSDQGAIGNDDCGLSLTTEMQLLIYNNIIKDNDCCFGEMLVEETDNMYYVKEICTGIEIPVLYSGIFATIKSDSGLGVKLWTMSPPGNVHTFVRLLQSKICTKDVSYFCYDSVSPQEVDTYLLKHYDTKIYRNELLSFFEIGDAKKKNYDIMKIDNNFLDTNPIKKLTQ